MAAAGGIAGKYKVEIETRDNRSDNAQNAIVTQELIDQAVLDYAEFDEEHADYQGELVDDVDAMAAVYRRQGKHPVEALRRRHEERAEGIGVAEGRGVQAPGDGMAVVLQDGAASAPPTPMEWPGGQSLLSARTDARDFRLAPRVR